MATDDPDAPDPVRQFAVAAWTGASPAWARHADEVDAVEASVTALLVQRSEPRPGDRVLELACGPGGVGLAVAPLVAPDGEVVCSDLVPGMAATAAGRAAQRGLTNVSTAVVDMEAMDVPDATFDAVLCREGLMLVADPARAAREAVRVLRPGGRLAVAVWGPRERNPWLGLVMDAVGEELGMPVPPPGVPGPFSLSDRAGLVRLLERAGLDQVLVDDCGIRSRHRDVAAWFRRTADLAGPVGQLVAGLPEATLRSVEDRLERAGRAGAFTDDSGVDLPGLALVASGRRGVTPPT